MSDTYWSSVKLLLNFEGADQSTVFTDESPSPKTIEAMGNVKIVTAEKKFGNSCAYFDGSGDYIRVVTNLDESVWPTYRNDFTLEMFIKTTDINASLFDITQGTSSWHCYINSAGRLVWYSGYWYNIYGVKIINDNVWHHIAFCRKDNDYRIYIDGLMDISSSTNCSLMNVPAYIQIGSQIGGSSYDYNGYMDCLRYSMVCRYWSGLPRFVPQTTEYSADADTVLLLHFEDTDGSTTVTDSSSTPKTVTVYNSTIITSQSKIGSSCLNLPSGTGRLSVTHADLALGSGDFTVECWIRPTALNYDWATIARFGTHSTNGCLAIARSGASNPMIVEVDYYYNGWKGMVATSATCPTNSWTHVAVTRKDGYIFIYINGAPSGGSIYVNPAVDANFNQTTVYIGADSNYGECFVGNIDEFRITKGVARYWGEFDIPTDSIPSEGPIDKSDPYFNNIVLYCPENDGITCLDLSSTRRKILSLGSGNTYTAAVIGPYGSFHTSSWNSVFQPAQSNDWNFGTVDFTIESFVWPKSTGGKYYYGNLGCFFYFGQVGEAGGFYCGFAPNESSPAHFKFYLYDGTVILTSNATLSDGLTWYHLAVVRYNNVLYFYINGTLDSSVAFTYSIKALHLYFGNSSTLDHPAAIYCDELRVTKGVARYTSNFIPNRYYKQNVGSWIPPATVKEVFGTDPVPMVNQSLYLPNPTNLYRADIFEKTIPLPWWEGGEFWTETRVPAGYKEGILSGTVKAGVVPIPGVKVFLFHRRTGRKIAGTISDSNGNFSFDYVGLNTNKADYFAVAVPDDDYNAMVYDKLTPT